MEGMETDAIRSLKESLKDQAMVLDHRKAVLWACSCAAHVLAVFESACPGDRRPREAVEAGISWARGELSVPDARKAAFLAHAAAREAKEGGHLEACVAARACGHACATAHVKSHAIPASDYALKATVNKKAEILWQTDCLHHINLDDRI